MTAGGLAGALDLPALEAAWRLTLRRPGPGLDGVDARAWGPDPRPRLRALRRAVLRRRYRPGRLLRFRRRKASGGLREIAVPTVADRVLQRAVLRAVTPRAEARLRPEVHGFRPGRGPATAVAHLCRQVGARPVLAVVGVDVADLFGTIPHAPLRAAVAAAWSDPLWRWLVDRWLRAWGRGGRGVPQGAPLSPLLANLFMAATVDRGLAAPGPGAPPVVGWVRYGDDLTVAAVEPTPLRVLAWLDAVHRRAGLALGPAKTVAATTAGARRGLAVLGRTLRLVSTGSGWRLEPVGGAPARRRPARSPRSFQWRQG